MDRQNNDNCSGTGVSGTAADDAAAGVRPLTSEPDEAAAAEGQARLMQKARQVVYQTPEVRREKVDRLKEAVDQGTYEVDARKVANRLITEELPRKR